MRTVPIIFLIIKKVNAKSSESPNHRVYMRTNKKQYNIVVMRLIHEIVHKTITFTQNPTKFKHVHYCSHLSFILGYPMSPSKNGVYLPHNPIILLSKYLFTFHLFFPMLLSLFLHIKIIYIYNICYIHI